MENEDLQPFLAASRIIDWQHPAILALACELAHSGMKDDEVVV